MKSLEKLGAAVSSSCRNRLWRRAALGGVALAAFFASTEIYGQGQYYPVNPPGAPYGATYTGITFNSNQDLQWLQIGLDTLYPGMNLSLQVPLPTTKVAPTTAQYAASVKANIQSIVSVGAPIPAITLTSMVNESMAWRPADRAAVATAVAQAILQYSPDATSTVNNLNTAVDALAKSQPTLIDTILPTIFNVTATSSNITVASSISQLVATAAADIPNDTSRVASIVNSGLTSLGGASVLAAADKTTAATNMVTSLLTMPVANNNPVLIDTVVKATTYGAFSSTISLTQALNAAVAALPTKSNATVGAVVDGALRSQGASAALIATTVNQAYNTGGYVDAVVGGYSNSATLAAFQTYVTNNAAFADGAASGAVVKGTLTPAVIVQWALTNGTATPKYVVAATIAANQSAASSVVVGAINTSTHTPWGATTTFGDIAWGGAASAAADQIGNVSQVILQNSASAVTSLNLSVVTSIVDNAIQGAQFSNRSGAYSDIVYKLEGVARNTTNASAALVTQAVDSITTAGGPSYLAVVAALSGDIYAANRAAIRTAGVNEVTTKGGDTAAANAGADLVAALQSSSTLKFTNIVAAFNTASALTPGTGNGQATNTVLADLYAATLTDSADYAAILASAIKQSSVPASTLTTASMNALQNVSLNAGAQLAAAVASHLQTEAQSTAGIVDLLDYVSHQIITNPGQTQVVAYAATTVDPDHAHWVAHAAAFNSPTTVSSSVGAIFTAAQITSAHPIGAASPTSLLGTVLTAKTAPGPVKGIVLDQPAVAAAITAGLTTGILEANLSATDTQNALVSTVSAAVTASIQQQGKYLLAPLHPFYNSTIPGDSTAIFAQSNGNGGTISNYQVTGPAGAITGFVAQITNNGDTTISAITKAVLGSAAGGGARYYGLEIAQAAAQALRWVGGTNVSSALTSIPYTPGVVNAAYAGNPAYDIAFALQGVLTGFFSLAQLETAATFGINQAANGVIGAGALGLNATGINPGTGALVVKSIGNSNSDFYQHRSATGTPVTNIFNL